MKVVKYNKLFLLFSQQGFFSGGAFGAYYQTLPQYSIKLVNTFSKNQNFFFVLKSQLKTFISFIVASQRTLRLGCFLEIKIYGIGYKCWRLQNNNLLFDLGYSHYIIYKNSENIFFRLNRTTISCFHNNLYKLGAVVSEILSLCKSDPYKGKGLYLANKKIILKAGKQR